MRQLIVRLFNALGLPGGLYISGKYRYRDGATLFPVRNAGLLRVAPGVSLHDAFFNLWDTIEIEEGAVIGHQVMFLTGRHDVGDEGVEHSAASGGPILVRRRAWIGSRATILGGVTIGEGAVVGAGAVVTRSVPPHEFWAGNPARYIRQIAPRPAEG